MRSHLSAQGFSSLCRVRFPRLIVALTLTLGVIASPDRANGAASSAAVLALVRSSTSIEVLPTNLTPPLTSLPADKPYSVLKGVLGCTSTTHPCSVGWPSSSNIVVLLGDSHAWMWSPAVNAAVIAHRERLIFMSYPSCPLVAMPTASPCALWKVAAFTEAQHLHPSAIVVAERTTGNASSLTDQEWTASLIQTLKTLRSFTNHVALIGDTPLLPQDPAACLARFPTQIQRCAGALVTPNGAPTTHHLAEAAAAEQVPGVQFIDPTPWLCAATCSPVVGTYAVYFDSAHIAGTYAAYLGNVMTAALAPSLSNR